LPDDSSRLLAAAPAAIAPEVAPPRAPIAFVWYIVRRGYIGHVLGMVVLNAINAGIETAQPIVLGQLVNVLATGQANAVLWFAALCTTWFFGYISAHAYASFSGYTQMAIRASIHDRMFAYLHDHAPRYFLDHASGALATKIRTSANAAGVLVDYLVHSPGRFGVMIVVTGVLILRQAPGLLPIFAVFLVVFSVAATLMARRMRPFAKAMATASAEQIARMVDSISNWDVVRSFARTLFERRTLEPYNQAELSSLLRTRLAASGMRVLLHALSVGFLGWLSWTAFVATRAGTMSIGSFTALVTLSILVAGNIRTLGDNLFQYFEHYGMLTEGLSALLTPHEIVDPSDARPLLMRGGGIVVRDLTFGYADGTNVFERFSLAIKPGERIGIVGPSGSGKSTLIKLLRRQFAFAGGQILIDGQDITRVTWDSLHEAFAEVPQNPSMFHRSVRDNIRYARPDASDDDVIAAAREAHCHAFIASRPKGYDSIVGEKGMKLSGGERQRVAIARAFLKNAPMLILDEATSSLDSEAEHLIQDGLLRLMDGRTVIAIAHRLSTIMHLDRIVVLEHGRVVEDGTHAVLLAKNGTYARLWNRQAGGFI
jgi:ATP-binding cassette subfamily B protein